jgi:Abortive infection alpha/Protein of unknown function (DUF2806)
MSDAGEIIKSGAADKLADIIHKLAGPMAEEIGQLLADKIKVYRLKNLIAVGKKIQKILAEAHLSPDAVPPRLFLPILEAASIESDETLQDLWAGLLASASDESDSLSPSFIETLKQLTPAEAKTLNKSFDFAKTREGFTLGLTNTVLLSDSTFPLSTREIETFERLGLIRREYDLQQGGRHKSGSNLFKIESQMKQLYNFSRSLSANALPELTYEFKFTEYGVRFMKACRGPKKDDAPST